ncbi:LLM class F420-dependent oxidoreductase [Xaviernesmea oryzae]|uniref:LLM class F420-dependent oxidoreductase n=1 Tax=Xaviernesmea oryzae TaxID=464029 RepID=A0A1Q9AWC4_9HYPH|nr:TIGR03885 family FMN-dependent LLM class oxidoreductase [Xaviernesmea oryzae]OLP59753.1 LLM class F420-dependent oxidoreductase [Xaviernesmea oryzae]SEM10000.1 probable non-F420 flavinoid oxidoreductase [Xaviernesmea oryzae]
MIIGYHASHEQFTPSELLDYVRAAEDAGFRAIMTSDHIAPWSRRQGNAGNNWAWLGAAMACTSLPFASLAIPGGWRYHPAVLAHLIATLAEMFPDRLRWIAVGSGEALNEHVVGSVWPDKGERNARLLAGTEIMRSLLRGEEVSEERPWFSTDRARLWSLPLNPPRMLGAALTLKSAAWMGSWADGLITVRKAPNELAQIVEGFRAFSGKNKPLALQLQISWAEDEEDARSAAWEQWRNAAAPPACLAELQTPDEFDAVTAAVRSRDIDEVIPLITRSDQLLKIIEECSSCGFDEIYIHNVSRDQPAFLNVMRHTVLPERRTKDS